MTASEPQAMTLEEFLIRDNAAMRRAGCELAEAALNVIREYDGTHRLTLAAAAWMQTIADEGGRGERHVVVPVAARDEAAEHGLGHWAEIYKKSWEEARDEASELRAAVKKFVDKHYHPGSKDNRPDYVVARVSTADVYALVKALRLAGGENEK